MRRAGLELERIGRDGQLERVARVLVALRGAELVIELVQLDRDRARRAGLALPPGRAQRDDAPLGVRRLGELHHDAPFERAARRRLGNVALELDIAAPDAGDVLRRRLHLAAELAEERAGLLDVVVRVAHSAHAPPRPAAISSGVILPSPSVSSAANTAAVPPHSSRVIRPSPSRSNTLKNARACSPAFCLLPSAR